jgi:hypothetical protein
MRNPDDAFQRVGISNRNPKCVRLCGRYFLPL